MKYLLLILFFAITNSLAAQNSNDSLHARNSRDTTTPGYVQKMQKRAGMKRKAALKLIIAEEFPFVKGPSLEESERLNQQIKFYLKSGIDTTAINKLLGQTKTRWILL